MAPVTNGRVLFNSIPEGFPVPGESTVYDASETIDIENVALDGGYLIKTLDLSIDPYMRERMILPDSESFTTPFTIEKPLDGFGVGSVIRSENPEIQVGVHLYGFLEHQQYIIRKDLTGLQKIHNPNKLPWSTFIGVLGMPGKTSFVGWKEFSRAKKGETAFVSTGAGPVGSLVIQLAKRDGLKVIASAGSDEKVKFMKKIGADVAFNYKTTKTTEVLEKEGPIDIYWDNVGGETLDAALNAANNKARFIECGMITVYNNENIAGIKNLYQVVTKSVTMSGFIVDDLEEQYAEEFYKNLPPLVASGEIQYAEDVYHGLESVGDVMLAVQKGLNKAKAVIHVADD